MVSGVHLTQAPFSRNELIFIDPFIASSIAKKGNSLFAEVDDQRQAMRHDMKSMRDKYVFVSNFGKKNCRLCLWTRAVSKKPKS